MDEASKDYFERLWPVKPMDDMSHLDIASTLDLLGSENGTPVVFVGPDGKKYSAAGFVKPHGENQIMVVLSEISESREGRSNTDSFGMPVVDLAPAEFRRKCCGALTIQQCLPDCTGMEE